MKKPVTMINDLEKAIRSSNDVTSLLKELLSKGRKMKHLGKETRKRLIIMENFKTFPLKN